MSYLESLYNQLSPINEVYFGSDNKELEKLQAQFSVFRSKYNYHSAYKTSINTDPELQKFNRMVEDFFGFKTFALVVEPSTPINAYTFPLSGRIDVSPNTKRYLIKTDHGFKYSDEVNYSCMVFIHSGLIVDADFTDREVFAIILHEIGHNFQQNFNPASTFSGCLYKALNLVYLPINMIIGIMNPLGMNAKSAVGSVDGLNKMVIKKADSMKRNNKNLVEAIYFIKSIGSFLSTLITNFSIFLSRISFFSGPISSMISILYQKIYQAVQNPVQLLMAALGYKGEKLSDEFATMYGYGADLSSALGKMEYEHKTGYMMEDIWTDSGFLNNVYDIFMLPVLFLISPLDCHPQTIARAKNQLVYLEKELTKNGIDPKMKKQIHEDISRIEESIDKMTNYDDSGDSQYIKKAYTAFIYRTMGGDIRELFNKNKPTGNYSDWESPVSKVKFK